jgi:hypothetical protein
LLGPTFWIAPRYLGQSSVPFQGHVVDAEGKPVAGALVEVGGIRSQTATNGDFRVELTGPPGAPIRIQVSKAGYVLKTIDTQSDVPDFGVVIEKERQ